MQYSIENFVSTTRTVNTRLNYHSVLLSYIEYIYDQHPEGQRDDAHRERIDELSIQYLNEDRDFGDDLINFLLVHTKDKAPVSRHKMSSIIHNWLEMNDITIKSSKLRLIRSRLPVGKPLTNDIDLSMDQVKSLVSHMPIMGKAMVLIMVSSAMRIGELMKLEFRDINFDSNPVEITIRAENAKNHQERFTFISTEAHEALQEWMKNRDRRIGIASRRGGKFSDKPIDPLDPRVFPFSRASIFYMFRNAITNAGLLQIDDKTNRSKIMTHSLRKFSMSQLKLAMPIELVELIAGHAGYLTGSYRRYPVQQVATEYLKAEYVVSLNAPDITLKMDLESQKNAMQSVVSESVRLKHEVDEMRERMEQIEKTDNLLSSLPEELKNEILKAVMEKM